MPFRPGGLEDILVIDLNQKTLPNKGLRTIPPGFIRGLRLPTDPVESDEIFSPEPDGSYMLEEHSMVRIELHHGDIVDHHCDIRTTTDWYHFTKTTVILCITAKTLTTCYQHRYGPQSSFA
jgi:hypothetical protein